MAELGKRRSRHNPLSLVSSHRRERDVVVSGEKEGVGEEKKKSLKDFNVAAVLSNRVLSLMRVAEVE